MRCPYCTCKLISGNIKGYYQCDKCKKFYYISESPYPIVTSGMPLNAIKQKRKKRN